MTIESILKPFTTTELESFTKVEVEYNECGGYLTAYDADGNDFDLVCGGDSDDVYGIADELANHLNVPLEY